MPADFFLFAFRLPLAGRAVVLQHEPGRHAAQHNDGRPAGDHRCKGHAGAAQPGEHTQQDGTPDGAEQAAPGLEKTERTPLLFAGRPVAGGLDHGVPEHQRNGYPPKRVQGQCHRVAGKTGIQEAGAAGKHHRKGNQLAGREPVGQPAAGAIGKHGRGAKYAQQHADLALGQLHGLLQGQVVDLENVNHVENGPARYTQDEHGERMA